MMMISLANLPFLLISQYQYHTIRIDLVVECYYHATIHERLCHVCATCLRLLLLFPSHVLPDLFPAVGGARETATKLRDGPLADWTNRTSISKLALSFDCIEDVLCL